MCGYYGGSITGITLGGTGGTFTKVASSGGYNAEIWANLNIAQSSTSLVITAGEAGIIAYAYEVAGSSPPYGGGSVSLDQAAGDYAASGTSWTSGATGATLGAAEFAVGLGFLVDNAGSITGPPAGGWTNERSYTDVVGADSFPLAAVSGYQMLSGSAAIAYSGTQGTNSASAAVTASFLLMPVQTGWGGYVFSEHDSYTGVSATFTVPSLSGADSDYCSMWVGLGNVYQTGIYCTYNTSSSGGNSVRPWSFWLPGAGENWNAAASPIAAGDSLTLTIELTSTDWLMTITNSSQDWSYTEVKSVLAVNAGSIQDDGSGPATWPYPVSQCEIIIEREGNPLPEYGSLAFTGISTTPAVSQAPQPIATVNTDIDQYPGAFDLADGSFVMYWNAYD